MSQKHENELSLSGIKMTAEAHDRHFFLQAFGYENGFVKITNPGKSVSLDGQGQKLDDNTICFQLHHKFVHSKGSIEKKEKGQTASDADMISVIQKTIKELEDEKANYLKVSNQQKADDIQKQMDLIKGYLPQMMSEAEIREEIAKLDDKSMPAVMKHFKTNFAGKVDMGLVNKIARSL